VPGLDIRHSNRCTLMIFLYSRIHHGLIIELTLDQALQKAVEAHKIGQVQEAERLYTAILQAQPKHSDANHNMGVIAVSVGKVKEALPFFKTALEANPNVGQYWLSYIDALIKLDRMPDAKAVFDQAKDKGIKGDAFDQLENRLSEFHVSESQSQDPDPSSEQLQPISSLYTQGQLQNALSETTQMLERFPNSVVLYNIAGASNAGLMQFDEAIACYKKALKIKPDYAEAYNNMGVALQDKGDSEAAIKSYKQALKIKPDYAEAYNNMGNALKDKGDLEAAIESYKKALKTKPDYAEAYSNMGVVLNDKGDLEAAIESFKKALRIKPDYADAHYNLGISLLQTRHYEAAAEHFKFSHKNSQYYLLRCLYFQNNKSLFYDQLDCLINQGEIHPIIGSLGCRSVMKYGIERPNLYCKDPLNYVLQTDLCNRYDFDEIFVRTARTILQEHRVPNKRQGLLTNGHQTFGNLFSLERYLTEEIQKIINLEIDKYLVRFEDSNEGLITSWPNGYSLYGWLVSMKSGGTLRPHMHEQGWLSGSIYINVPEKLKTDSGNLVVCIEEEKLIGEDRLQEKSINVVTGSLCLFPASLLHYTIPFESKEERIVLAFDVVPKS
jgi:tetratricopeptide (TPR) repeat protein